MRIELIGILMIFLTVSSVWAARVGNISFAPVSIKDKMVMKLIDRKMDVHIFFKKADIVRSKYRNYTVESDASDVVDQGNRIAAIQFSTYGVASGAGRSDFHEVVKCAFVDTQSGKFLFEGDAQMCDGEWKQPKIWQDGSGRHLDFDKLPQ